MSYGGWLPRCAICKQSVNLTESKADEYGRAVHENCYVSMLVLKKPRRFRVRIDSLRERLSLMSRRWAAPYQVRVILDDVLKANAAGKI
jgi:hypothetical protein